MELNVVFYQSDSVRAAVDGFVWNLIAAVVIVVTDGILVRLKPQVEAIALPPGYALEWHGEYKASREANEGLALSAPYGFAAMVLAAVATGPTGPVF